MKKIFLYVLVLIFILSLSGCEKSGYTFDPSNLSDLSDNVFLSDNPETSETTSNNTESAIQSSSTTDTASQIYKRPAQSASSSVPTASAASSVTAAAKPPQAIQSDYMKGIWISYYEYNFKNHSYKKFMSDVDEMMDRAVSASLNTVIVHTRANADSLYKSDYFPWMEIFTGTQGKDPGFDPLEYMVKSAHQRGLKIEAWINPYRVCNKSSDIAVLSADNPARVFLTDGDPNNDSWVIPYNNKIYFNPAIPQVQQLIINGVREIVENYNVDGIQFDDYFYPTTATDFDAETYNAYASAAASPLSLSDWRTANVSSLIAGVWRVTHSKGVSFGISPAAHIGNDAVQKNGYADFYSWMSQPGYIDYIAPQLYFGMEYPKDDHKFPFLLSQWTAVPRHSGVKLYIGLAAYKIGKVDKNNEWIENSDILSREAAAVKNGGCNGFMLYSYSSFFESDEQHNAERQALINTIK